MPLPQLLNPLGTSDEVLAFFFGGIIKRLPCDLLYQKVCEARERLAERAGISFEDRDLLAMVEGLEEIGKVLAMKMFEYGAAYGKLETG